MTDKGAQRGKPARGYYYVSQGDTTCGHQHATVALARDCRDAMGGGLIILKSMSQEMLAIEAKRGRR